MLQRIKSTFSSALWEIRNAKSWRTLSALTLLLIKLTRILEKRAHFQNPKHSIFRATTFITERKEALIMPAGASFLGKNIMRPTHLQGHHFAAQGIWPYPHWFRQSFVLRKKPVTAGKKSRSVFCWKMKFCSGCWWPCHSQKKGKKEDDPLFSANKSSGKKVEKRPLVDFRPEEKTQKAV